MPDAKMLKCSAMSIYSRIQTAGFFSVLLLLISVNVFSESLDQVLADLPEPVRESLAGGQDVFRLDRDHEGIRLLPDIELASDLRSRTEALQPDVFTEGLYLIPYPEGKNSIDPEIYNMTRNISSISQVIYKSHRKDAYVPLFDDVYAVSGLKDKAPLPDPLVQTIPVHDRVIMHMKEVNLGSAYYETEYISSGGQLGFFLKNLTNLRKIIKVAGKEQMQISLIINPVDQGYLVYGSCAIRLSNANAVSSMMDPYTGFYRRLYALVTWIYNTMHGTSRLPDFRDSLELQGL